MFEPSVLVSVSDLDSDETDTVDFFDPGIFLRLSPSALVSLTDLSSLVVLTSAVVFLGTVPSFFASSSTVNSSGTGEWSAMWAS